MTGFDPSRLGPVPGARVAVVGGCGGMGRVLVRALLDTGVQVAVLDLPASLAQNPPPPEALAFSMDGSDAASVETAFAALGVRWPHLDGFVNLAGFFKGFLPISELPVEVFDEIIAGNLRCHFLCARAALPLLHRSGQGLAGQRGIDDGGRCGQELHPLRHGQGRHHRHGQGSGT